MRTRTLALFLLSLSIAAFAWVLGVKGARITVLHIIATPQEVRKQ